jgi:hypothetical protein
MVQNVILPETAQETAHESCLILNKKGRCTEKHFSAAASGNLPSFYRLTAE